MAILWLIFACGAPEPGPASAGSASARLAERTAAVGPRAHLLAERARHLAGEFDALRTLPEAERPARIEALRAQSAELEELARELDAEVQAIEASAQVW